MKRYVCSWFAVLLLVGAFFVPCTSAIAMPPTTQPRYVGVTQITALMERPSNNVVDCIGRIKLSPGYTADGQMELQQLSGNAWETIKSWDMSGTDTIRKTSTWAVLSSGTYRVVVSATIYDSNGRFVETVSAISV